MEVFKRIKRFIRNLFREPRFRPGTVEDSPEVVLETERKRGMRGF